MAPLVIFQVSSGMKLASAVIGANKYLLWVDPTMNFKVLLLTKLSIAPWKVTCKGLGAFVEVDVSSESYFASETFWAPRVVACEPFLRAAHREGSFFWDIWWFILHIDALPLFAPTLWSFGRFKFLLIWSGSILIYGFFIWDITLIAFLRFFTWYLARSWLKEGSSSSLCFLTRLLVNSLHFLHHDYGFEFRNKLNNDIRAMQNRFISMTSKFSII